MSHFSFVSTSDINSPTKLGTTSQKASDNDDDADHNQEQLGRFMKKLPIRIKNELHLNFEQQYPPNPLLPKTFLKLDDSPKLGGLTKFIKLIKFKGQDIGKSKFREEANKIEHLEFPDGTTIRQIFKPLPKPLYPADTVANRIQNSYRSKDRLDSHLTNNPGDQPNQ